MEAAVTWLVLWGLIAFVGAPLVAWIIGIISVGLAAVTDKGLFAAVGIPLAYVAGFVAFVFALIQAIIQLVTVIQLV